MTSNPGTPPGWSSKLSSGDRLHAVRPKDERSESIDSDHLGAILTLASLGRLQRRDSVDSSLCSSPLRGAFGVQTGNADLLRIALPLATKLTG